MSGIKDKVSDLYAQLGKPFEMRDFVLLWMRTWVAKIFYDSGRTKAGDNYWEINDFQGTLFEEEYGISFVDPELAAQLALYAETILPIMVLLGVASRLGALGLVGMTIFIQFFVYPHHFTDHATWIAALGMILCMGPGKFSLDHFFNKMAK